jgi:hypothetical protein
VYHPDVRISFASGIILAGCLAACGGGSGRVELSGKSPADGSAQAADAICRQVAACGEAHIICVGGSPGVTDCTATITPVDHTSCYADVRPDIEQLLTCPDLTPPLIDVIELCVNALARQPCLTQAEADALAARFEAGEDVSLNPPECAAVNDPNFLPGC